MRVTKAQAEANRARIVETASSLFRERGYDGVGVADLMASAGFTHGGFYNHFQSKAELMAEAAKCGMSASLARSAEMKMADYFRGYLSRQHRDSRDKGCTLAALCGDVAREPEDIKSVFAAGIDDMLAILAREAMAAGALNQQEGRSKAIDRLARAVGAVILSRACPDDSHLADEILKVCRNEILEEIAKDPAAQRGS